MAVQLFVKYVYPSRLLPLITIFKSVLLLLAKLHILPQGDLMNSTTHVRLFLCELETEEDKFYLGEEEVARVDIIGTVVYISQRERVITFQSNYMFSLE